MDTEKRSSTKTPTASTFQPQLQAFATQGPDGQQMQFTPFPQNNGYGQSGGLPMMYNSGQLDQQGMFPYGYPQATTLQHNMLPQTAPTHYNFSSSPAVNPINVTSTPGQDTTAGLRSQELHHGEQVPLPGGQSQYFFPPQQYNPSGAYPQPRPIYPQADAPHRGSPAVQHYQANPNQAVHSTAYGAPHPYQRGSPPIPNHHTMYSTSPVYPSGLNTAPQHFQDPQEPVWCFHCQQWHSTERAINEAHGMAPPTPQSTQIAHSHAAQNTRENLPANMTQAIADAVSARLLSMGIDDRQQGYRREYDSSANYASRASGSGGERAPRNSHQYHPGMESHAQVTQPRKWRALASDGGNSGGTVRTYDIERRRRTSDSPDSDNDEGTGLPLHTLPSVPLYEQDHYSYRDQVSEPIRRRDRDEPRHEERYHKEKEREVYSPRGPLKDKTPLAHKPSVHRRHRSREFTPPQRISSKVIKKEDSPYLPPPSPVITPRGQENRREIQKHRTPILSYSTTTSHESRKRRSDEAAEPRSRLVKEDASNSISSPAEAKAAVFAYAKWFAKIYRVDASFMDEMYSLFHPQEVNKPQPVKTPHKAIHKPAPPPNTIKLERVRESRRVIRQPSPIPSEVTSVAEPSVHGGADAISSIDDYSTTSYEGYTYEDLVHSEHEYASESESEAETEVYDRELVRREWEKRMGKSKDKRALGIRGGRQEMSTNASSQYTPEFLTTRQDPEQAKNRIEIDALRGLAQVLERNRSLSPPMPPVGYKDKQNANANSRAVRREEKFEKIQPNEVKSARVYSSKNDQHNKKRNHATSGSPQRMRTDTNKQSEQTITPESVNSTNYESCKEESSMLFERSPRLYTSTKPTSDSDSDSDSDISEFEKLDGNKENNKPVVEVIESRTPRRYSMQFDSGTATKKKDVIEGNGSGNGKYGPQRQNVNVRKVTNPELLHVKVETVPDDLSEGHGWKWDPHVGGYVDLEGVGVPPVEGHRGGGAGVGQGRENKNLKDVMPRVEERARRPYASSKGTGMERIRVQQNLREGDGVNGRFSTGEVGGPRESRFWKEEKAQGKGKQRWR